MEPFPPELIAQIATKLFQQGPHDPSALNTIAQAKESMPSAPAYGKLPEIPAAFPRTQAPDHPPVEMPSMPAAPSAPFAGFPNASSLPNAAFSSVPSSTAPLSGAAGVHSFSESTVAPVAASESRAPLAFRDLHSNLRTPASAFSHDPKVNGHRVADDRAAEDGLARFVAQVRNQSPAKRNDCLDSSRSRQTGSRGPQPHFSAPLDVSRVRDDFPILRQHVHGQPLAWLDNAATTQKPQVVIDAISRFYETDNSNIHRAAHSLAARATDAYEAARDTTARFLGARSSKDIVFARGTTEAINLVSNTYGARYLKKDDEILLSTVEHHANIVPWQMIAKRKGAVIRVIPINDRGEIIMDEYLRLLSPRTRIVALTHASNSLGSILPVAEMTHMAKRFGARVLIDGAQSVSHMPINVQAIGCDFFVFSGHKIFGPTGVGALYVTEELHDVLPPWQGGGNMIKNVTFEKTTYSDAPAKFEAGTPNIADAVGLKAALDYVAGIGLQSIAAHEHALLVDATEQLSRVPGLRIIGHAREKVSVISFVLDGHSTEEVGQALDRAGIAVRSGHHCAQPSLRRFGLETTVRPSFSIYNTHHEVSRLVAAVRALAKT
ncbi:MAG: SufS family cysteine desulfurase [Pirellulaceae bacterium]|nr:SufS family cysteine desulfurase [Pirellulaceae bacterium]